MNIENNVLIIDDDAVVRTVLSSLLKKEGFNVYTFENPVLAMEYVNLGDIGIIIADIMMPEMNGIQFCYNVKKAFNCIYLILVSAKDTIEDLTEGFDVGADDYVQKPFNRIEMIARVKAGKRIVESYKRLGCFDKSCIIVEKFPEKEEIILH